MKTEFNLDVMKQIGVFCATLEWETKKHFKVHYSNLKPPVFYPEMGKKYTRIVTESNGSRSVVCFVRNMDGAILKAASWKAPVTKSPRGSIFAENCDVGVNVSYYGARYLR